MSANYEAKLADMGLTLPAALRQRQNMCPLLRLGIWFMYRDKFPRMQMA